MFERNYSFYHHCFVFQLRDVPKTVIWVSQNGGEQAVFRGRRAPP